MDNQQAVTVTISGSTHIGRGWDDGYHRDSDDPIDQEIRAAMDAAPAIKRGKGFFLRLRLSRPAAHNIFSDLNDWGAAYATQADPDTKAWGRAMLRDAKRIMQAINESEAGNG